MIEVFHTSAFRTAALASAIFGLGTLLLFTFIYLQTTVFETQRTDRFVRHEASAMAREAPADLERDVRLRFAGDLHRDAFAAVLTAGHEAVAGDLIGYPQALVPDALPARVLATREVNGRAVSEAARAVAVRLADGRLLVVGRSERDLVKLRAVVERALELGLLPGLLLALGAGTFASVRTLSKVRAVNDTIAKIMDGNLHERLPVRDTGDAFDRLSGSVNRMLDDLERLLDEVRGVGDNVAHDLRTPLARLRARLEGARRRADGNPDLSVIIDSALSDLDQTFATITALMRIGEIEGGHRRSGFARVSLRAIAQEAGDLYLPMAELNSLTLVLEAEADSVVVGDRDLLFEAVANLVDNAIKFSPPRGRVTLRLTSGLSGPTLGVEDDGAGIPVHERDAVMKRFYRGGSFRHVQGSGLGLSLVAAILRLHGFTLAMRDRHPGFAVTVIFGYQVTP